MLSLVLLSTLSLTSQAKLLAPEGAPAAAPEATLTPSSRMSEPVHPGLQMAAGSAAALVFVPASLYLGQYFGSLSNSLIWSAIPLLLCIGFIPPIAVTIATVLAGNWNSPGRYRWVPAFFGTFAVNAISLAVAILATPALSVGSASQMIIYTLIEAVLQPGAAVAIERAWPRQQAAVITVRDPIAPTTWFAPTAAWSF